MTDDIGVDQLERVANADQADELADKAGTPDALHAVRLEQLLRVDQSTWLGHLPVRMITHRAVDRAVHGWTGGMGHETGAHGNSQAGERAGERVKGPVGHDGEAVGLDCAEVVGRAAG